MSINTQLKTKRITIDFCLIVICALAFIGFIGYSFYSSIQDFKAFEQECAKIDGYVIRTDTSICVSQDGRILGNFRTFIRQYKEQ